MRNLPRTVLRRLERNGIDPWQHVKDVFEGRRQPEPEYAQTLVEAGLCWRKMATRRRLIDLLVRFELTTDQVGDILNEETREERGILANNDAIATSRRPCAVKATPPHSAAYARWPFKTAGLQCRSRRLR